MSLISALNNLSLSEKMPSERTAVRIFEKYAVRSITRNRRRQRRRNERAQRKHPDMNLSPGGLLSSTTNATEEVVAHGSARKRSRSSASVKRERGILSVNVGIKKRDVPAKNLLNKNVWESVSVFNNAEDRRKVVSKSKMLSVLTGRKKQRLYLDWLLETERQDSEIY